MRDVPGFVKISVTVVGSIVVTLGVLAAGYFAPHVPVVRTVTRTVIRTVPKVEYVTRWKTRTVTVQAAAPAPAQALPAGVKAGPRPGTYYVDCLMSGVQCTSLPGAGPFGTTCSRPSTGEQLCQ